MIFTDIFCCALNGKYSALYIKGRRDTGGRGRKGGGEEEERRKGEEGVSSMCASVQATPRFYGDFSPQL